MRGLSAQCFLDRLGADPQGDVTGFDALVARDHNSRDDQDKWGEWMFVGATLVQGINGGIGTQTDAMKRATADTRGVSHFRSPNAMSLFS